VEPPEFHIRLGSWDELELDELLEELEQLLELLNELEQLDELLEQLELLAAAGASSAPIE
jgi:hypothetical protein